MPWFDWLTFLRRTRPTSRRGIGIRKFAYQHWQGATVQIESMESRVVLAAPVAASDSTSVHMNSILLMSVSVSDSDFDPLSVSLVGAGPIHGVLILSSDGFFQYTPHQCETPRL